MLLAYGERNVDVTKPLQICCISERKCRILIFLSRPNRYWSVGCYTIT